MSRNSAEDLARKIKQQEKIIDTEVSVIAEKVKQLRSAGMSDMEIKETLSKVLKNFQISHDNKDTREFLKKQVEENDFKGIKVNELPDYLDRQDWQ
jgi:predicted nucleic acid-binding protein